MSIHWLVNGEAVGEGSTTLDWTFRLIENPLYNISVVAADSLESDTVNWEVSVRDLGVRNGKENGLNQRFSILDISPNPFNDWTSIHYSLPVTSLTKLAVFNLSGREVARLVNRELEAGDYTLNWSTEGLTSGIYIVKMETADFSNIRKIALLK